MPQVSAHIDILGEKTNPNYINSRNGGLANSNNINIDRPNIATSRRGFKKYSSLISGAISNSIRYMWTYLNRLYIHFGSTIAYDNGYGGFTNVTGSFSPVDSKIGIRHVETRNSLYITTADAVKKATVVGGDFVNTGVPRGLTVDAVFSTVNGFMTADTQVAYRVVWGYKDDTGRLVLGSPSGRTEVANTTTDDFDITLTVYIPAEITTDYFVQVYRSYLSASSADVATDEMYLAYETAVTSADITAGYITIEDILDESLLGVSLYTNATQEGISQSNDRPPLAKDITLYKDYMLYANTQTRHELTLTIIAVGGSNGINIGDTLTLGSNVYTAGAAENTSTDTYKVETSLTVAENIANTARSLVKIINLSTSDFYAYYLSSFNDLPGQILIQRYDLEDTAFSATVSARGGAFNPTLPTSGTSVTSTNEQLGNRLYISKQLQPEAVPSTNYIDAGNSTSEILRVIALRDSVFIFKSDGEIWRMVGEDVFSFAIRLFDNTVKLYSPKTAVVFNNQIFCFSNQGVVSISDSGVAVVSFDIEDQLYELLSPINNPNFEYTSYGISYESDRKYILSTGSGCFVYNSFTNAWTKWDVDLSAAVIKVDEDKLYIAKPTGYVYDERKSFSENDYADEEYALTLLSYSGTDLLIDDVTNISVGDALKQGELKANVVSITLGTGYQGTVAVDIELPWDVGTGETVYVQKPILCELQFLPLHAGTPAVMKRFSELQVSFQEMNKKFVVVFANNFNTSSLQEIEIEQFSNSAAWGSFPWGEVAWGGVSGGAKEIRTYIPLNLQRALWMNITVKTELCYTDFSFNGMTLFYMMSSQRFNGAE